MLAAIAQPVRTETEASLEKSLTDEVKKTITSLYTAVKKSQEAFDNFAYIKANWSLVFALGALIAAIIVGTLVGKLYSHRDERELEIYSKGLYLEKIWDKIDKKERKHLNALAASPTEKSEL